MFITCINLANKGGATKIYTPSLSTSYAILNSAQYQLRATLIIDTSVSLIKFNKVIFNKVQFESTGIYYLTYQLYSVSDASVNNTKSVSSTLVDNLMFGLSDFSLSSELCVLDYQWEFDNTSSYAIKIYRTNPVLALCGLATSNSHFLLINTFNCPATHPYYNSTSGLCQNMCADYYYENTTSYTCTACYYACMDCTTNSSTSCTSC